MNKILQFKKSKGNTYQVVLDTKTIILYDDIITKYELIRKKQISDDTLETILKENQVKSSYYKALNYLDKRVRSEKEIRQYLKKQGYLEPEIESTIKSLKDKKYLNEMRYIELYVGDSIRLKLDGPEKIKKKLIDLGISQEKITSYLKDMDITIWQEKIQKLISKKSRVTHSEAGVIWRKKLEIYLNQNGYSKEYYQELLDRIVFEEDKESLEKEMKKWLKKYSSKWSGEELNFKVKQKLFQKGYQKESIEEVLKKTEDE